MQCNTKKTYLSLIREGIELLRMQINQAEKAVQIELPSPIETRKREVLLKYKLSELNSCWKITNFLLKKIQSEAPENLSFYLCNARSLLEIYARLLHLHFQPPDVQCRLVIVQNLFTLAKLIRVNEDVDMGKSPALEGIIRAYDNGVALYNPLLDDSDFKIPENPIDFSSNNRRKYGFPNCRKILMGPTDFLRVSTHTWAVFPNLRKGQYPIYVYLSDYSHANRLVMGGEGCHGNEEYWLISRLIVNTALLCELTSCDLLHNLTIKPLQDWLARVSENNSTFREEWKGAKIP